MPERSLTSDSALPAAPAQHLRAFLIVLGLAILHAWAVWGYTGIFWGEHGRWLHAVARFAAGEVPYRDFFFVQPPLTLYLHSLWLALPDGWSIAAGRIAYYAELTAAAGFVAWWAAGTGRLVESLIRPDVFGVYQGRPNYRPPARWHASEIKSPRQRDGYRGEQELKSMGVKDVTYKILPGRVLARRAPRIAFAVAGVLVASGFLMFADAKASRLRQGHRVSFGTAGMTRSHRIGYRLGYVLMVAGAVVTAGFLIA